MRRSTLLYLVLGFLLSAVAADAATVQYYCKKNFRKGYATKEQCIKAEEAAGVWLKSRPIDVEILSECRRRQGEKDSRSFVLIKKCVGRETDIRYERSVSPYNLRNSKLWYAPRLRKSFPSIVRACGFDRPVDSFAVLPKDITRFNIRSRLLHKNMMSVLRVSGTVKISALPRSFRIDRKTAGYKIYIDAFLISADGRSIDVRSTGSAKPVSAKGGTVRFSLDIGRGYYFDRGGTLLLVASGSPIRSDYPSEPCAMIGGKIIRFKKR
ncbi:MAG: hypothetical protein ACE5EB_07575 [Thermodesulfobacteriota bacterium]